MSMVQRTNYVSPPLVSPSPQNSNVRMNLFLSFLTIFLLSSVSAKELDTDDMEAFLNLCSECDTSSLQSYPIGPLMQNLQDKSPDGESCLHLVGICGESKSVDVILDKVKRGVKAGLINADQGKALYNARVATEPGLNMPVISWFAFGGHLEGMFTLLAEEGLIDVNAIFRDERHGYLTVLDVVENILAQVEDQIDVSKLNSFEDNEKAPKYLRMYNLLKRNDAKGVLELWNEQVSNLEKNLDKSAESGPYSFHPRKHDTLVREQMYKHQPVIVQGKENGPDYIMVAGDGGEIVDQNLHPMKAEHRVMAVYIKNENGDVVFYKDLHVGGVEEVAKTYFVIPKGVERPKEFIPYEYCNLHGLWEGVKVRS